jgi:phosphoribosyl 1,2-cyclic phosphate phosphodiesterase
MTLTFTILGCGSSGGVPRPGLGWGDCDPKNPKNRRRRTSLLIERRNSASGVTRVLIDTTPDLREQLLAAEVSWLDGVFYTHAHADHTHGIDDLRALVLYKRRRVDVYVDAVTSQLLRTRFDYCFDTPPGSEYPPIAKERRITVGHDVVVEGDGGALAATPFDLQPGPNTKALGFRFGDVAYTPDVNAIPDESLAALEGLDLWIIDALRPTPHPTHFSLPEALAWIERMKPRRAVLTNLHSDLDYARLKASLPNHVDVAYDGLRLSA